MKYHFNIPCKFIWSLHIIIGFYFIYLGYISVNNISIGQITIMNFKPINIALTYNFIDGEENNFHQLGIELFKEFNKKYIIKFGFKFDYGDNENIDSSYLTFNYCI